VRAIFGDDHVATLDDRAVLRAARTDPSGLLAASRRPLVIDEVQRGGDGLVLAIKAAVDRDDAAGQFILTGSSRFLTVPTLSESLAGRARIVDLLPLSVGERTGGADSFVERVFAGDAPLASDASPMSRRQVMELVVTGGFPEVRRLPIKQRSAWFESYHRTVIERDVAELRRLQRPADLARLLTLAATRTAQEVNVSNYARTLGVPDDLVREYLALMESIYVHRTLPSWASSATARTKRRPKLHFVDSGLAAHLAGTGVDLLADPTTAHAGAFLETFVVGELAKQCTWTDLRVSMFHFRDREQREVDVILERADGSIAAVEVKAAIDVDDGDTRWLRYLRDRVGDRFVRGVVLCLRDHAVPLGDRISAAPITALWA
jgi:uncharacterized protein